MALTANLVYLSEDSVGSSCREVRRLMHEKFGQAKVDQRIPTDDWARWSVVVDLVKGTPSLLDIGTAHGGFLNSLSCAKAAQRLVGVDIRDYSLYSELFPGFERIFTDAEKLPFDNGEFDTVTCMEVIEHLPDGKMENVIAQLRRVANRRLIMSVPFCEGLPLYKGHWQRFTPDRIEALFPTANFTLMVKNKKGGVPWLIIEETSATQPALGKSLQPMFGAESTQQATRRRPDEKADGSKSEWRRKLWHLRKKLLS